MLLHVNEECSEFVGIPLLCFSCICESGPLVMRYCIVPMRGLTVLGMLMPVTVVQMAMDHDLGTFC